MALPSWFKWIILIATSVSTFASYGYIGGSASISTIYYIHQYNERLISGIIGPVQLGLQKVTCLPMFYVNKVIGNRLQQIIGGILMSAGIALTSLTTVSWQGLLLTGVCSGIGSGMMHVATTNAIKEHFPGGQIGPFGAVCLSLNLAPVVVPQLWTILISTLQWELALVSLGALLSVNILCGLTYVKQEKDLTQAAQTAIKRRPKISLLSRKSSSHMFIIPEDVGDSDVDAAAKSYQRLADNNSNNDDVKAFEISTKDDKKLSDDINQPSQVKTIKKEGNQMWQTLKRPESIALLTMSGLYGGGIISGFTVMGDYAERFLGLTDSQITNALSIQGVMQIVSAVVYLFLTVCTDFGAVLLQMVSIFALSGAIFMMTFINSEVQFCIIVGIIGFFKAITTGNAVPMAMEVAGPQAMHLYVLKCLIDGLGVLGMPFLAVYIQETINDKAALYLSSVALLCSGCIFIPFIKRFLQKPRIKSNSEVAEDSLTTINYVQY